MPVLEMPALFTSPVVGCPVGARIRFGVPKARRARTARRPRRARLPLSVLTTSGPSNAMLAALTLYGATLDTSSPLRRRELVALRMPSGRRIKARVRWRLGSRCGVTFLTPVADFARLLRECRTAGRGPGGPRRIPILMPTAMPRFPKRDWMRPLQRTFARMRRMGRQLLRWCRAL